MRTLIIFIWSPAWHQHDVQELCRVMFDALEKVFKDTDQVNEWNVSARIREKY
jgi:hypothetical protein